MLQYCIYIYLCHRIIPAKTLSNLFSAYCLPLLLLLQGQGPLIY